MSELPASFDLSGKAAVVTGSAGLLGSGFCRTLAEAGASVVLADNNAGENENLAKKLDEAGFAVLAVKSDITDPDSVEALVEQTLRRFGRLDILVNSAALDPKFDPEHQDEHSSSFEKYALEDWNQAST
jgi:NAD(P)-dependent dehydrogenase (short-subunit alcohol dehydrogenase family)